MPYGIRYRKGQKKPWKVINKNTGDVKGSHSSRTGAEKQRRLLEGIKHGWTPTKGR